MLMRTHTVAAYVELSLFGASVFHMFLKSSMTQSSNSHCAVLPKWGWEYICCQAVVGSARDFTIQSELGILPLRSSLDASLWEVNWSCLIKQRKPRVALKMVFSHPWGFLQNAPICRTGENGLKEKHERDWGEMSGERREPRIPTVRPGCWGVWQAGSQPVPQRPCFAETRLSPWRRRVTKIIV